TRYWAAQATAQFDELGLRQDPNPVPSVGMAQPQTGLTRLGQQTPVAIATAEVNFVQISDSHIGFYKPANTDVVGTTREAILRINALPKTPEFLLHTGDLTHLTEPAEFDTLAQLMKECRIKDVFYVPGEHDFYDNGEKYRERFGKNTIG